MVFVFFRSQMAIAAEQGYEETALEFLSFTAWKNSFLTGDAENFSKLFMTACMINMWKLCPLLLTEIKEAKHIDLTLADSQTGNTAIHYLAIHGQVTILEQVLRLTSFIQHCSMDINMKNNSQRTAVWYAIMYHDWNLADLLLISTEKEFGSLSGGMDLTELIS